MATDIAGPAGAEILPGAPLGRVVNAGSKRPDRGRPKPEVPGYFDFRVLQEILQVAPAHASDYNAGMVQSAIGAGNFG